MKNNLSTIRKMKYRNTCLVRSIISAGRMVLLSLAITGFYTAGATAQGISRDLNVDLLINHAGYLPDAGKSVVARGTVAGSFEVIDLVSQNVVFTGTLKPFSCDFGNYSTGDFSGLTKEGHYYVKCDTLRSYPFKISPAAYRMAINLITGYFSLQRCGSSTTGYLSPCHLDDGVRMDNGKHQDVTGGWHDASDLRKWVSATIYGMLGLSKTYELMDEADPSRTAVLDELMWGNRYFLKMQEPAGYIMNFVGGDVQKHSDSNRWTDNIIGAEGGELGFVKPTAGKSTADMLLFGAKDDRVIRTDPAEMVAQYNFVTSEATMARITLSSDPEYSLKCLEAAVKCFEWCLQNLKGANPGMTGASIMAANELYKTTNKDIYRDFAVEQARKLKKLQAEKEEGNPSGFFFTSEEGSEPYKNISRGCLEFIAVAGLAETLPDHRDISAWKQMLSGYALNYVKLMSGKNSFGIVPYGLFPGQDPGGDRKAGKYWYRYFMQPELSWWVGINANLASAGIGLAKASKILNDPALKALAQKQLDWITGVNPFNSSTVIGIGYNHPPHFGGSTFLPKTPVLPGAVLNGLGGDSVDQPVIGTGNWQISEYWTPMVAYTQWLMAEISHNH